MLVDEHLIPLFEKHSGKKIEKVPVSSDLVRGIHLGTADTKTAVAVFKRCEVHHDKKLERTCPGCQEARYDIAKELVHTVDRPEDKTSPDHAAHNLLDELMREAWDESSQAFADGWAEFWGLELLVRFRHRVMVSGSRYLIMARASNDYSFLAGQYCVPQHIVRQAFKEKYMALMKGIREKHGLPCGIPDLGHGN